MHRTDEPHPFALETARLQYAADRPVVAKDLALALTLNFDTASISGEATHVVEALSTVKLVTFDAVELTIKQVTVDGRAATFDCASGQQLHVHLPRALRRGEKASIVIVYEATPRRGLYFVGPDAQHPKRPRQAWTQGQDIDSRWYFPCLDTPAQKCPTQVTATFPAQLMALSNGRLIEDRTGHGERRMTYRLDAAHSPYLVTLVVGEFEVIEAHSGQTLVRTYFPKGRREDALRCVKRTPQMLALFESLTGYAYPWGDYAQVFVAEFIFGGMENTSATTLTDSVLHDARAALDYSAEPLIAHELAHQWFGDLLTCRDWSHGWLNEGFATYLEVLWKEHADGADEADLQREQDLEAYLDEVSDRYSRPIVARRFDAPIDLFDRHLYEKGGLVLHELRTRLGDEAFRAVVQAYVGAHAHGSVETVDLARAVERATGRNLDRFFDEYLHRAGHPQLKVDVRWDAQHQVVRLGVKQTQQAEPYALTLPVELVSDGRTSTHALWLDEKEHVFTVPAPSEPKQVLVDPRRHLLATLEVEKPIGLWREELLHATCARARTEAAAALGKDGAAESVRALAKTLRDERVFHATRAACAKGLAKVRSPQAKAALLSALAVKHPKARRGVVAALGSFVEDPEVASALAKLCAKGDPSAFVEAEAARSLGKVRGKGAFELLRRMLGRRSFADTVRGGAIDGLVELADRRGWDLAEAATRYGQPPFARRGAVVALAKLAEPADKKSRTVERITELLRDPSFRVRLGAIEAAAALGDERLLGPLTSIPFLDGREQRRAREAARTLRAKSPGKELQALRGEVDTLKAELRSLKERVELRSPPKKKR
jgi:aminopeptidase N